MSAWLARVDGTTDIARSFACDTRFMGHPMGLGFLSFAEAWERFSYYGMQTLLVLYMVHGLLLPGHREHVLGLTELRQILEGPSGHWTIQALASAIFGLYAGAVYLTPIVGGLLADRILGRTRTVVLGAVSMAAGHFLMAFEALFLFALILLILGNGCFKGNIASQVGGLYDAADLRRAEAFQIYYIGINTGVVIAPLVCGSLGELMGWHWGFAAAGVGMLIGLSIYFAGRSHLPPDPARGGKHKSERPPLTHSDVRIILLLLALIPVLAIAVVTNQEIFNAYLVWIDQSADLSALGFRFPTTWLITLDSVLSISALAGSAFFWQRWAKRYPEPDELTKLVLGCVLSASGALCLAFGGGSAAALGTKVNFGWLLGFHVLNNIGFANLFPVSLALYSRTAPRAIGSTIIGVHYLYLFASNLLVGWLGGLLDKIPTTEFWLIHAGLTGSAGLIFLMVRSVLPLIPDFPWKAGSRVANGEHSLGS